MSDAEITDFVERSRTATLATHGADGGIRAVEHWRTIVANFQMHAVRQQVSLSLFTEFGDNRLQLEERREGELTTLVEQLTDATRKFVLADELAGATL